MLWRPLLPPFLGHQLPPHRLQCPWWPTLLELVLDTPDRRPEIFCSIDQLQITDSSSQTLASPGWQSTGKDGRHHSPKPGQKADSFHGPFGRPLCWFLPANNVHKMNTCISFKTKWSSLLGPLYWKQTSIKLEMNIYLTFYIIDFSQCCFYSKHLQTQ